MQQCRGSSQRELIYPPAEPCSLRIALCRPHRGLSVRFVYLRAAAINVGHLGYIAARAFWLLASSNLGYDRLLPHSWTILLQYRRGKWLNANHWAEIAFTSKVRLHWSRTLWFVQSCCKSHRARAIGLGKISKISVSFQWGNTEGKGRFQDDLCGKTADPLGTSACYWTP